MTRKKHFSDYIRDSFPFPYFFNFNLLWNPLKFSSRSSFTYISRYIHAQTYILKFIFLIWNFCKKKKSCLADFYIWICQKKLICEPQAEILKKLCEFRFLFCVCRVIQLCCPVKSVGTQMSIILSVHTHKCVI